MFGALKKALVTKCSVGVMFCGLPQKWLLFLSVTGPTREFVYRNIELYKSESLGSGYYGSVCKAKCDGLLCAAKILHSRNFRLRNPSSVYYLHRFRQECRILKSARHPNLVQYLATFCDPDTRLPVLVMELCDENLSAFLRRSPGPLSYRTQLSISHDIALALAYLHSNNVIHRDLTIGNILMVAGPRAKITDFGVSKLIDSHYISLSISPGNMYYMAPEALHRSENYNTDKLDVFSFGVLQIQIATRLLFSNPNSHSVNSQASVTMARHQSHLKWMDDSHPLKTIAMSCLKEKSEDRPSAQQLSDSIADLKQDPQYAESRQVEGRQTVQNLRQQTVSLQQENRDQKMQHQTQIGKLQDQITQLKAQLQTSMRETVV